MVGQLINNLIANTNALAGLLLVIILLVIILAERPGRVLTRNFQS